jgi:hypothetical protein
LGVHFGAADTVECEALVLGLDEHRCAANLQIRNMTDIDKTANQREYRLNTVLKIRFMYSHT